MLKFIYLPLVLLLISCGAEEESGVSALSAASSPAQSCEALLGLIDGSEAPDAVLLSEFETYCSVVGPQGGGSHFAPGGDNQPNSAALIE